MKNLFFRATIIALIPVQFFSQNVFGQSSGDFRTSNSGDWDVESTWQYYNGVEWIQPSAGQIPKLSNHVIIQSGHSVTLKSTAECKSLQIQEGGILSVAAKSIYTYGDVEISGRMRGSNLPNSSFGSWYIRGDNPNVKIDGILGGTTLGGDGEGIILYMYQTSGTKLRLFGNGQVNISALLVKSASANNYIADIDIDMNLKNSYNINPALSLQNQTSGINSERIINILSGRKVVITDPSGCFHATQTIGTNSSGGKMTYQIYGTLDVSASKFNFSSNSSSIGNQLILNVLSGGKLLFGYAVNLNTNLLGQSAPKIILHSGSVVEFKGIKSPVINCTSVVGSNSPIFPWNLMDKVIFDFNDTFTLSEDLNCKRMYIGKNVNMNVLPNTDIVIGDTLENRGKFIFQNDYTGISTLISHGYQFGDGLFQFNQQLNSSRNWYVSSPLQDALISSNFKNFAYNEQFTSWEEVYADSFFIPGKGYVIQSGTNHEFQFTGKMLNNQVNTLLTRTPGNSYSGFNLVGNPYPTFLNVDQLLNNNQIEPTFWYRSKFNDRYVFDTYNLAGGTYISNSGFVVSNWIPPFQAFWLKVKPGYINATISFDQFIRGPQENAQNLFRTRENNDFPELRISVSDNFLKDESLLYHHPFASDSIDKYDSFKMFDKNQSPMVYNIVDKSMLAINGIRLKTDLNEADSVEIVRIGIRCVPEKDYSLIIKQSNYLFNHHLQFIFKDHLLNTAIPLKDSMVYRFQSDVETIEDRFSIQIYRKNTLTFINAESINKIKPQVKFMKDGIIYFTNKSSYIYDVNGRYIMK